MKKENKTERCKTLSQDHKLLYTLNFEQFWLPRISLSRPFAAVSDMAANFGPLTPCTNYHHMFLFCSENLGVVKNSLRKSISKIGLALGDQQCHIYMRNFCL